MADEAGDGPESRSAGPVAERPGLMDALVRASPDAVVVVDADGAIQMASPAVEDLFGYQPADLVGQAVEVLIPERFRAGHVGQRQGYAAQPQARPMGAGLRLEGRRRDGTTFPIDVALAPVALDGERWVGAYVRDGTERRRGESVLEFANEVNQRLLYGEEAEPVLELIAGRARGLVGAEAAWIVVPAPSGRLVVAAADGEGTGALMGVEVDPAESLSGRVMAERGVVVVEDMAANPAVLAEARALGLGAGMYVPLADDVVLGALVVARGRGRAPFDPADAAVAEVFASAAGVALSLGRARRDVEELAFTAEHDRIARDLHDTVIQRLFALGMGLQGVLRLVSGPAAERINAAVDALDEVIRDIRETIFDLSQPVSPGSLRREVRQVVDEAAIQLGFGPGLVFRGPVDAAVPDRVAGHVVAVVREGLSNVARHSGATQVEVVVEAAAGTFSVRISDDGVGPPAGPRAGRGLANMAARAEECGGACRIGPGPLGGSLLEWEVPVS